MLTAIYRTDPISDVSEEQKEELIKMAQKYSPVFNTVSNPTPVSVELEK